MTDEAQDKGKRNLTLVLSIVFVLIILIVVILALLYSNWIARERAYFEAALEKTKPIQEEIIPYFTTEENAQGNAASYLRVLIATPGIEDLYRELRGYLKTSEEEKINKAADWLSKHPDWVTKVCELEKYGYIRFWRDYAQGPNMEMREWSQLRGMFRLNRYIMVVLADNGDIDKFMKLIRASLHAVSINEEPLLISHLVNIACYNYALAGMGDSILRIKDASVLKELIKLLDKEICTLKKQIDIMKGELLCSGVWAANRSLEEWVSVGRTKVESLALRITGKCSAPYIYRGKTRILESFLRIVEISSLPYPECVNEMNSLPLPGGKYSNIMISMLTPIFSSVFIENQKHKTLKECWKASLCVHFFYLENERLPDSLNEIEFFKQHGFPTDHFLESQLIYKKYDDPLCFRIKDVGQDGRDSGEYLQPKLDSATGKYTHKRFGWNEDVEEHIVGIDYYIQESEESVPLRDKP